MEKSLEKFLKFRTGLIELLNKYRYELSGTGLDDGSININDLKNQKIFILKDGYSDYEALDSNWQSLPIDYILNVFSKDEDIFKLTNKKIGIFTNNRKKAETIFNNLRTQYENNISRYRESIGHIDLLLDNGTYYVWIKPIDNSRGHKVSGAYIDKNLTLDELFELVVPICVYCKRKDIIIF